MLVMNATEVKVLDPDVTVVGNAITFAEVKVCVMIVGYGVVVGARELGTFVKMVDDSKDEATTMVECVVTLMFHGGVRRNTHVERRNSRRRRRCPCCRCCCC